MYMKIVILHCEASTYARSNAQAPQQRQHLGNAVVSDTPEDDGTIQIHRTTRQRCEPSVNLNENSTCRGHDRDMSVARRSRRDSARRMAPRSNAVPQSTDIKCMSLHTIPVQRQMSGGAAILGAFGCTFVLAPACSIRVPAEDSVLLHAFAQANELSIVIESEFQSRGDCWEMVRPKLSADASRVYDEDNAGGASRISEALSMEVLARVLGAHLVSTELELSYWPANGPMTDFAIEARGVVLGVSVTRAFAFRSDKDATATPSAVMGAEQAEALLRKKLNGVIQSSSTCYSEKWQKQVLHVWASSAADVSALQRAFELLGPEVASNSLVLITLCCNLPELFSEKGSARGSRRTAAVKGLKDDEHIRILEQSDPVRRSRGHFNGDCGADVATAVGFSHCQTVRVCQDDWIIP